MTEGLVRKSRAPGGIEQRASQRAELQVEVTFTSDSHFFVGLTNDISTGGVFVSTYRPMEIGQQVQMEFALPEGTVQVKGTVRWKRGGSETTPGVGIAFEDLAPEHMKLIQRFCDRRPPLYYDLDE